VPRLPRSFFGEGINGALILPFLETDETVPDAMVQELPVNVDAKMVKQPQSRVEAFAVGGFEGNEILVTLVEISMLNDNDEIIRRDELEHFRSVKLHLWASASYAQARSTST
jgi:hypothetical protein